MDWNIVTWESFTSSSDRIFFFQLKDSITGKGMVKNNIVNIFFVSWQTNKQTKKIVNDINISKYIS